MESVMTIDQKMLAAKSFFLLILVSLGTASTTVKSVAGNAPTVTPTIRGNATVVTTGKSNAALKTDAQPKPTASGIVNTNTKNSIDTIVNNKVNVTNSNTSGPINGNNNKTVQLNNTFVPFVPYVAAATLKNCHLLPKDQSIVLRIKESLNEGTKMIKFHLNITHQDREFHGKNESRLYRPYFWVRSTGRHGTGLLLLRPEYDVLSLTTLEFGVVTMDVALKEEPAFCLRQLAYSDVEVLIRELVMNDFQNTTSGDIVKLSPTDSVCNMHIVNVSGVAEFRHYCCQRDETLRITCDYLKSDTWIEVLFGVIAFLKIIIILFSPILIPDGLYRVSKTAVSYAYNFAPGKTMTFRAVLTKNPGKFTKVKNKFKLSKFCHMDKFKTTLRNMLPDVPYDLTINQAEIRAKQGRLLPEDKAPVGLFETMIESFVKCKIRERASLTECCNSNFFTVITIRNRFVSWHRVLKEGMKFVVLIVLVIPWLLRVAIYYGFEHDEMHMRKDAANEKSLKFYFPGSVTLYLTPLHALFILIYLVLTFESCVFGIIGKRTRERFKIVLRKCFRDMREINRIDVFGWLIRIAVKPCTKFGCIGICIGLVSWVFMMPFLFIILSFYIFPTVNVTFRLLAHFVLFLFPRNFCSKYTWLRKLSEAMENVEKTLEMERITKEECLEKRDSIMSSNLQRLLQLVIIILCLISMYSIIFLITEFISFIVEVFVYTLMGIILNASVSMTYISLAFLLGVYGNDCFGYVNKTFLSFNKTMNGVILGLGQTQVEKEVYSTTGKNVAFGVQPEGLQMVEEPVKVTSNVDGLPRWRMSRIVLFLSDKDQPMLPRGFYFRSCRMPYYAAPGELLLSYTKAFAEFSTIVIFLLFVLVVVMAFGDIYVLSPTNRMLATIAGGFLPFMLRNFVFQSHAVPSVDTSSLPFKVCLYDLLRDYEQTWPIYDIDVIKRQTLGKYVERLASIEELNETNTDVFENDIDKSAVSETIGLINDTLKPVDNDSIDMLIVVPEIINQEEFPGMFDNETSYREFSGSTSFLDDTEWPADA